MTRGERTGRPRERLQEDDMRRGMGSDQAQSTLRAFDARTGAELWQGRLPAPGVATVRKSA